MHYQSDEEKLTESRKCTRQTQVRFFLSYTTETDTFQIHNQCSGPAG